MFANMHGINAYHVCMTYMHTYMFANMHDINAYHVCMTYMHSIHT